MDISRWARTELWRFKPSVDELIRLHNKLHRHDTFAEVIKQYPFGIDILAKSIKELMFQTDNYEFFLARMKESKEIVGWIAISFDDEKNEAQGRDICEARLEWTEMCSHILKTWKVESAGEKSNVWDVIRRISSNLRTQHLPRNYCIINAIVIIPGYWYANVASALLQHVIEFWRRRVMAGTEWAIWVQAPYYMRNLYIQHAFQEVGEYEVDLGDHGFFRKGKGTVSGRFAWRFLVRVDPSGSAVEEPDEPVLEEPMATAIEDPEEAVLEEPEAAAIEDPEEVVLQEFEGAAIEDPEEVVIEELEGARKDDKDKSKSKGKGKGKGKERRSNDPQEDEDTSEQDAERRRAWEEAEQRLEDIQFRRGRPPMPGEVAGLVRTQRRVENQGLDTTDLEKRRGKVQPLKAERPAPPEEPPARSAQKDAAAGVTVQQKDNFTLTKWQKKLFKAMREGGIDEEEIDLIKAIAFSLTSEAKGG